MRVHDSESSIKRTVIAWGERGFLFMIDVSKLCERLDGREPNKIAQSCPVR